MRSWATVSSGKPSLTAPAPAPRQGVVPLLWASASSVRLPEQHLSPQAWGWLSPPLSPPLQPKKWKTVFSISIYWCSANSKCSINLQGVNSFLLPFNPFWGSTTRITFQTTRPEHRTPLRFPAASCCMENKPEAPPWGLPTTGAPTLPADPADASPGLLCSLLL